MSNTITIEWCAEDRARIDRLIAALERKSCDKCVESAPSYYKQTAEGAAQESPQNTREAPEAPAATTAPQAPESPTAPAHASETAPETPTVSLSEVQQKVVALATAGKKAQARDIVRQYAERVTLIPADKLGEVYAKLVALEKGASA